MSKKVHNKLWLDRKSRKLQNIKYHKRMHSYGATHKSKKIDKGTNDNFIQTINESRKTVPSTFSFLDNTCETIDFFNEIVLEIKQRKYKNYFFIDSSNVTSVTVDALIYQIAIMQNVRINYEMKYTFRGNLPQNVQSVTTYQESGFMSYVQSKIKKLPESTNKMQIISGTQNDPTIASSLCQFVMEKLDKQLIQILNLQKILIELMSNVYHHAYNNDDIMNKHWYIYAEYVNDHVRFVFVDTGAGIARTVRKNFYEKIQRFAKTNATDGDLIFSTLMGDFRTKTKEKHRGNGLSGVRSLASSDLFRNFTVISGGGQCIIQEDKNIIKKDFNNTIYGTMYIFDVV